MNKIIKILLAVLGGVNAVFNIFIPIIIAILLINVGGYGQYSAYLLIAGIASSLFRGIEIGFMK